MKIFVVEDDPSSLEMLTRRLLRKGFAVTSAVDGPELFRILNSEIPDLIILDIGLPGMDGYEIARLLKSDPHTSNIPLIALTAHAMKEDREKGMQAKFDEYETKPLNFASLLVKIEALTKGTTL